MAKALSKAREQFRKALISTGKFSFQEIANIENEMGFPVTRAAIHSYTKKSGLYCEWKLKRGIARVKEKCTKKLENLASLYEFAEAHDIGPKEWAFLKAKEFYEKRKFSLRQPNVVFEVFSLFFKFGADISLSKIAKSVKEKYGIELYPSSVKEILNIAGERSPKSFRYKHASDEQIEAVKNGLLRTRMNLNDIAYFADVSDSCVSYHLRALNNPFNHDRELFLADFGCKGRVTKRLASRAYEMVDQDIPHSTIRHRLGRMKMNVFEKVLPFMLDKRPVYGPQIVSDIKIMYPHKASEISLPYLT